MSEHSGKLFYSIGEVAAMFEVNESLLRYWEKEFETIKPKKNAKGTRAYTKETIEAIRQVYYLVKERKMTLEGAKKQLKEQRRTVSTQLEVLDRLKKVRIELLDLKETLRQIDGEEETE